MVSVCQGLSVHLTLGEGCVCECEHSQAGPLLVIPSPGLREGCVCVCVSSRWASTCLPLPSSGTFSLAGVVCLHEISGAAAEVAALGVVTELRAGAESQALIDVCGKEGVSQGRAMGCLAAGPPTRLPTRSGSISYPGIRAAQARCGILGGRHSRLLSQCAHSVPHPRRCWRWWHSWSSWDLWDHREMIAELGGALSPWICPPTHRQALMPTHATVLLVGPIPAVVEHVAAQ